MRTDTEAPAETPELSTLPDPEDVLTEVEEAEDADELTAEDWLDEETEEGAPAPDETTPGAAAATPPAADGFEARLNAALDAIGTDRDAYLSQLEAMAREPERFQAAPAIQPTEDQEVTERLQGSPNFMRLYNRVHSGEPYASDVEEMTAIAQVENAINQTRLQVRLERQQRQTEQFARDNAQRQELERVAQLPRFSGYLNQVGEQRGLLAFAKKHGIANLEVAAMAYFSDREFQRGRTTQTKARRAATPQSSVTGKQDKSRYDGPKPIPDQLLKHGSPSEIADWMIANDSETIRRRLGGKGRL